jgi:hypothetical protein
LTRFRGRRFRDAAAARQWCAAGCDRFLAKSAREALKENSTDLQKDGIVPLGIAV